MRYEPAAHIYTDGQGYVDLVTSTFDRMTLQVLIKRQLMLVLYLQSLMIVRPADH